MYPLVFEVLTAWLRFSFFSILEPHGEFDRCRIFLLLIFLILMFVCAFDFCGYCSQDLTIKSLIERLAKVNENLKKYSHVNKKALEQYVGFSEQRETLLLRKTEIDKGQAAIKELIEALDLQKDEVSCGTSRTSAHPMTAFLSVTINLQVAQCV